MPTYASKQASTGEKLLKYCLRARYDSSAHCEAVDATSRPLAPQQLEGSVFELGPLHEDLLGPTFSRDIQREGFPNTTILQNSASPPQPCSPDDSARSNPSHTYLYSSNIPRVPLAEIGESTKSPSKTLIPSPNRGVRTYKTMELCEEIRSSPEFYQRRIDNLYRRKLPNGLRHEFAVVHSSAQGELPALWIRLDRSSNNPSTKLAQDTVSE